MMAGGGLDIRLTKRGEAPRCWVDISRLTESLEARDCGRANFTWGAPNVRITLVSSTPLEVRVFRRDSHFGISGSVFSGLPGYFSVSFPSEE